MGISKTKFFGMIKEELPGYYSQKFKGGK